MNQQITDLRAAVEFLRDSHVHTYKQALAALDALERAMGEPIAYLYHDAKTAQEADPLLHSTLLVMAAERRQELRNETPLYAAAPPSQRVQPQPTHPEHHLEMVKCKHHRYSLDVQEQVGHCIDCGVEGRMKFVVEQAQYPLPDDLYPGSKDWLAGSYDERVAWLHTMYEGQKALVAEYEQQLAQQAQAEVPPGDDLYWRLHSLSKSLEGRGWIDEQEDKDAYPTILDAMAFVRKAQAEAVPQDDLIDLLKAARAAIWQPSNPEICERIDAAIAAAPQQKGGV